MQNKEQIELRIFDSLKKDDIFNGIMLSDGSLEKIRYKNSRFNISQAYDRKELVLKLQEHFIDFGVFSNLKLMFNKKYNTHFWFLYSQMSTAFSLLRNYWYKDGHRIVPMDIKLTPLCIAYWFMGDGTSSWHTKSTSKISLYTNTFPQKDTIRLSQILIEMGIHNFIREIKENQFIIEIKRTNSVDKFYEIVEPYILNCFKYKIKKRKIDGRILTKGIHKSPETEFKKGVHYSPKTEFKKGHISLNKGIRINGF